jgi:tetratricopeptide (TPR) repeat protein
MGNRKADKRDRNERREDILRPSRYLGYDRDQLALHLMHREAFEIAESQFRRAAWLNPFEPAFKVHLAECLYHMHQYVEAREWASKALEQEPDNNGCRGLLRMIDLRLASPSSVSAPRAEGQTGEKRA